MWIIFLQVWKNQTLEIGKVRLHLYMSCYKMSIASVQYIYHYQLSGHHVSGFVYTYQPAFKSTCRSFKPILAAYILYMQIIEPRILLSRLRMISLRFSGLYEVSEVNQLMFVNIRQFLRLIKSQFLGLQCKEFLSIVYTCTNSYFPHAMKTISTL